jgi:tRNA nucleotidyltransferase (CCA-adding enzyme)
MEQTPSTMFQVLRDCGALARILPELDALFGVPQPEEHHPEIDTGVHVMMVIDYAANQQYSLPVRFAALTHDLGKGVTPPEQWPAHHGHEKMGIQLVESLSARLRVSGECGDVARLTARFHGDIHRALELRPATILKMLAAADVFRKPARFEDVLKASECDFRGRPGFEEKPFPQAAWLRTASRAARDVDAGKIAVGLDEPARIKKQVTAARISAISEAAAKLRQAE